MPGAACQAIIQIAALLPAEDLHGIEGLKHEAIAVIFRCDHCPYVKAWEDRMVQIQRYYGLKGVQTHPRPWHGPTGRNGSLRSFSSINRASSAITVPSTTTMIIQRP